MDKKKKIFKILDVVLVIGMLVIITFNTYSMLADGLSMYGRVSRQDIFNKLNELF